MLAARISAVEPSRSISVGDAGSNSPSPADRHVRHMTSKASRDSLDPSRADCVSSDTRRCTKAFFVTEGHSTSASRSASIAADSSLAGMVGHRDGVSVFATWARFTWACKRFAAATFLFGFLWAGASECEACAQKIFADFLKTLTPGQPWHKWHR